MHDESKREAREKRALHKDWRTWAVVLLMVGAMAMYVLTLDDSLVPVGGGRKPAAQTVPVPQP